MTTTNETLTAQQIFSRIMVEGVDLRRIHNVPCGAQSLFGEQFGNGGRTRYVPDSEVVEFDYRKGNRAISSFVPRGVVGKPMNKPRHVAGNFTSIARTFPLLADEGVITANELLKRAYAEPAYQPLTQFERARRKAGEILEDIICDHLYCQELVAWQMLKTGKMDLIIGTSSTDEQIDTKRTATHTFTVTASWATAGTSILDNMDSICTLGVQDAGKSYDVCVCGTNLPGYLAANTEILSFANIVAAGSSGFSLVWFGDNYKPDAKFNQMITNGFIPICKLTTKMGRIINVFRYEGGYKDSGGTFYYYVGAKEALFFSSAAACDRYFGPPEKLPPTQQMVADWDSIFGFSPDNPQMPENVITTPGTIDMNEFSCSISRTQDNNAFIIACQAAPMFVARDTDAFAYILDITAP